MAHQHHIDGTQYLAEQTDGTSFQSLLSREDRLQINVATDATTIKAATRNRCRETAPARIDDQITWIGELPYQIFDILLAGRIQTEIKTREEFPRCDRLRLRSSVKSRRSSCRS